MNWRLHGCWQALLTPICLILLSTPPSLHAGPPKDKKKETPAVRWAEQNPGCTYLSDPDGKFRYGLWSGDIGIITAVDSQELEKVHRRHERFFAVLLTVKYRGAGSLDLATDNISLEFVDHFHVVKTSLDPDSFAERVQKDADNLNDQTARWVAKHPDHKEERESFVRAFLKDSAELQEFLGKNSLRATQLNPGHTETTGWVLFSTESKWIGGWKKQEEFLLRVPLEDKIYEFPFKLPPKPGEVILRKRE
ncbi:MAG TPA: hypothetical protein VKQ11_03855 [Candidatus Sulfotelmatobacter sp.]|nr:hypothetical protein [Candidatus Sulfotelmatobacter sp.]